ncbi:hypothetical protein A5790_16380 [Mycobacterium sp. 852002-51152_SCH6134967]|nr:hypothetical protein A5790_16380 [Mycobacterium sp. 852002-51152_SCH6134967]
MSSSARTPVRPATSRGYGLLLATSKEPRESPVSGIGRTAITESIDQQIVGVGAGRPRRSATRRKTSRYMMCCIDVLGGRPQPPS